MRCTLTRDETLSGVLNSCMLIFILIILINQRRPKSESLSMGS